MTAGSSAPRPVGRRCRLPAIAALILLPALVTAADTSDTGAAAPEAVKLRNWYLGGQWTTGDRDSWAVFGRDELPPAAVGDQGRGFGLQFGRRFGGRFLLGLQLTVTEHDLVNLDGSLYDLELLITGTVLFRERCVWQPFVRGGFGGAAVLLEESPAMPTTAAVGTAAIAGGGVAIRVSRLVSLEVEAVANVANILEVQVDARDDRPSQEWRVKRSHAGWRVGCGLALWF